MPYHTSCGILGLGQSEETTCDSNEGITVSECDGPLNMWLGSSVLKCPTQAKEVPPVPVAALPDEPPPLKEEEEDVEILVHGDPPPPPPPVEEEGPIFMPAIGNALPDLRQSGSIRKARPKPMPMPKPIRKPWGRPKPVKPLLPPAELIKHPAKPKLNPMKPTIKKPDEPENTWQKKCGELESEEFCTCPAFTAPSKDMISGKVGCGFREKVQDPVTCDAGDAEVWQGGFAGVERGFACKPKKSAVQKPVKTFTREPAKNANDWAGFLEKTTTLEAGDYVTCPAFTSPHTADGGDSTCYSSFSRKKVSVECPGDLKAWKAGFATGWACDPQSEKKKKAPDAYNWRPTIVKEPKGSSTWKGWSDRSACETLSQGEYCTCGAGKEPMTSNGEERCMSKFKMHKNDYNKVNCNGGELEAWKGGWFAKGWHCK